MFRPLRLLVAVVFGSLLVGLPISLWIGDRSKALHILYPATAALAAPTLSCSGSSPKWMAGLSKYTLWRGASPAGQLAYISPDANLHTCHYGWIGTPLRSGRVTENTRFRYASLTKLLTADLVLRDTLAGRLALDQQVLELLRMDIELIDERWQQVTVRQLLRHSSGVDRLRSIDSMVVRSQKPWCPYKLSAVSEVKLDFYPGTEYAYHNLNYCLLGVLLEKVDASGTAFRVRMEQEYDLSKRRISFIDGPYLEDEVTYDFRHTGFYGPDYWQYFDFNALSSSMGLSGSARALAELLASLGEGADHPLIQAPVEPICDETVKRGCFGYALFRYRPADQDLLVHVQPGLLYGAPSLAVIDEHGGITVWVGNGSRHGGGTTDAILDQLYVALAEHYAVAPP